MLLTEKIGWHDLLPYGPHRFAQTPPGAVPYPWRGICSRQMLKHFLLHEKIGQSKRGGRGGGGGGMILNFLTFNYQLH